MVADKKAPTPYCVSVSTALMQTNPQMVELWAKDFDKGAFDNCSPKSKLYFTFDGAAPIYARINEEHFYKVVGGISINATAAEYAQGKAYKWLPSARSAGKVFTTCGDINIQIDVWDEAWNTDYCNTVVSIIGCGTGSIISGKVATALGNDMEGTTITFQANTPEYPKSILTIDDGTYEMNVLPSIDYIVDASKDGDYKNGVTTLDLVLIQRHILGLSIFDDPYKEIAADANNDGKITASDLVELRKLILGLTDKFANASWRFPIKGQQMTLGKVMPYVEQYTYQPLTSDMSGQDFVAVKIGDINSSVVVNMTGSSAESRTSSTLQFHIEDAQVKAGEIIEVPVTSDNFTEIFGCQMTINPAYASIVKIESGAMDIDDQNVAIYKNGKATMSFAARQAMTIAKGEVLFTLYIKPAKNGMLSEMLTLSSDITKGEYYTADMNVGKVSLRIDKAEAGIELFQNEPNPFKGTTTVSFEMPEAATATLSVYDVTGKVVTVRNIDAIKGLNSEVFTKDQLGVSGVLYYTLVSGDFTATKKMIIVE